MNLVQYSIVVIIIHVSFARTFKHTLNGPKMFLKKKN